MATAVLVQAQAAKSERHVRALDGVRGIAILLVLAVHLRAMNVLPQDLAITHRLAQLFSWGWSGVDLFFVLSGFLITGILLDTKTAENRALAFYARRVLRIFPLYYIVLTGCLGVYILFRHSPHGIAASFPTYSFPTYKGFFSYFIYLQNWWMPFKETDHLRILGHFWSLAVEEQFYLLWPWFVWNASRRRLVLACVCGFVAAFALRWFFLTWYSALTGWFVYMNVLTRMDALLAGAFCAIAVREVKLMNWVRRSAPFLAVITVAGLLAIILIAREIWEAHYYTQVYGYSLLAVAYSFLVLSAYRYSGTCNPLDRLLSSRVLRIFGKYSYGIYVYQGFVENLGFHFFSRYSWWGRSVASATLISALWIAIPFGIAVLSYRFLETPFLRLKGRFVPSY